MLKGHQNAVLAVAFLADGKTVLSGSADRLVKLWDAATGKETTSLDEHRGAVRGIAVSPNGKTVATAGSDRRVVVWNVADWTVTGSLRGHTGPVRAVAFSPDGNLLATGSDDNSVRVWDAVKREIKGTPMTGHTDAVTGVAFSPRGQLIATSSGDKTLRLWETATGGELANLEEGHADAVHGVAFAPSGRQIATASGDKSLGLWTATLPRVFSTQTITAQPGWTGVAAVSPDGELLGGVGGNHAVRVQDALSGEVKATLGLTKRLSTLAFSPDGTRLVSVARDKLGFLVGRSDGKATRCPRRAPRVGSCRGLLPGRKSFATAGIDKRILIYDVPAAGAKPAELREKAVWDTHRARSLASRSRPIAGYSPAVPRR